MFLIFISGALPLPVFPSFGSFAERIDWFENPSKFIGQE